MEFLDRQPGDIRLLSVRGNSREEFPVGRVDFDQLEQIWIFADVSDRLLEIGAWGHGIADEIADEGDALLLRIHFDPCPIAAPFWVDREFSLLAQISELDAVESDFLQDLPDFLAAEEIERFFRLTGLEMLQIDGEPDRGELEAIFCEGKAGGGRSLCDLSAVHLGDLFGLGEQGRARRGANRKEKQPQTHGKPFPLP